MANNSFQYNIGINVNADTKQAEQQFSNLKTRLTELSSQVMGQKMDLSKGLNVDKAAQDVIKLTSIVNNSTDAFGKLDLGKFTQSLHASHQSLNDYAASFKSLGPEGQKAFLQINAAIASAEKPLIRAKGLLQDFIDQMVRTTSIQLSYGILNSFVDVFRNGISYAQRLDKSLTDIQIVTKQNTQEITKFAERANRAAKQLAVSTTEYTDAALIFYQQGLDDEAVKERTDVTIKMANASGEAAKDISSYMTAIWNNFDDGSKSLEYYADVIAKLGADTAASNADIAEGMQDFAAVADTVGLSFEYASSALALLVDKTQQSANVIGNSLKTIFARLESVSLGDTLEDDTNLTKYTKALDKVGVTIKEADGSLKDMDTILDELGEKWEGLNEQQKMGVAYTVAGVRQYNNFISLMNNYDDYLDLIDRARNSTGELNKEQEIYAKSWEAARDQVQAAAQGIYQSILDDDFFKSLTRATASVLNIIQKITDGFGGMKGAFLAIGAIASTVLKDKIAKGLSVIGQELFNLTKKGQIQMQQMQQQALKNLANPSDEIDMKGLSVGDKAAVDVMQRRTKMQLILNEYNEDLSDTQKQILQQEQAALDILGEKVVKAGEYKQLTENAVKSQGVELDSVTRKTIQDQSGESDIAISKAVSESLKGVGNASGILSSFLDIQDLSGEKEKYTQMLDEVAQHYNILDEAGKKAFVDVANAWNKMEYDTDPKNLEKNTLEFQNAVNKLNISLNKEETLLKIIEQHGGIVDPEDEEALNKIRKSLDDYIAKVKAATDANRNFDDSYDDFNNGAENFGHTVDEMVKNKVISLTDAFTNVASIGMQVGLVLSSVGSAFKKITDPDLSGWEKFTAVLGSLVTIMPTLIALYKAFGVVNDKTGKTMATETVEAIANALAKKTLAKESGKAGAAEVVEEGAHVANTGAMATEKIVAKSLGTALLDLWTIIAPFLPAILAITAALGALVLVVRYFIINSPESKLKRANEELERAKEAANAAAEAYSNLIDTLDGLDSIYDKLNKLTVGTIEWKDAVLEANEQAEELIKLYNLIEGKDFVYDSNGVIRFTEEGEANMKQQAYDKKVQTRSAMLGSQMAANEKQADVYRSQISGYITGGYIDESTRDKLVEMMREGSLNFSKDNWKDVLSNSGYTDEFISMIDSNKSLRDALTNLTNCVNDNTNELKMQNMTDLAAGLSDDSEWKQLNDTQRSDLLYQVSEESAKTALALTKDQSFLDNLDIQKVVEDYAATFGYDKRNSGWYTSSEKDAEQIDYQTLKDEAIASAARQKAFEDSLRTLAGMPLEDLLKLADEAEGSRMYTKQQLDNRANAGEFNYGAKDLDSEAVENYTQKLMEANKELAENYDLAKRIAVANMNYNDGLADIMKNYEDYIAVLKDNNRLTEEFASTAKEVKNDLSKMFEVDSDNISDDFITNTENIKLMERAAKGDLEAVELLRDALSDDIIASFKTDDQQFNAQLDAIEARVDELSLKDVEIGTSIGDIQGTDAFLESLNALLEAGELTEQQVNDYLNAIGFEPKIEYEKVDLTAEEALVKGAYIRDEETGQMSLVTAGTEIKSGTEFFMPRISASETKFRGSAPKITSAGNKAAGAKNAKGGGGSKAKSKNLDDERERYHVINKQLTAISKELDNISKAKDRAFGQKHLDLLDAEINKYEELAKTQQQYIDEIQSYWNSDAAIMKGYGANIDPNTGTILNYDQLVANAVAAYNAAGGSEAAEEAYNNFKKNLSNYEDSVAKMQEANATLTDYLNAIYDAKLEKVKYKVELKLDIADDDIKYLDFLMNLLKDDTYDVADKMNYIARQGEDALSKIDAVNEGLVGLFNNHMPGQGEAILAQLMDGSADIAELAKQLDLTADEVDFVRECVEHLEEETINFKETFDKLNEELINSMQKFGDKIDEQVNKMEHLNSVLESFKNITNLIGKSRLGPEAYNDTLRNITEGSVNLSIKELTVRQKEYEAAKKAYEDAVAAGIDPDTLSKLEDELNAIEETFMQSWEDALQKALDALTEGLQRATDKFGDAVSGLAGSLDELSFWYDKAQEQGDNYLDKYERVYNLNKLIRDITNSIDDTDDLAGKKQLKGLMEEIEELNEKDANVSAYQLDTLRKRYELYQAEIALREAENAKSQVRMVADAEGNYNYMYTADENNISEAQGNYEDKLYAYAQANTQQLDELQQRLLENRRKLSEELAALGDGDQEKAQELIDWYTEQEEYLEEQMQLALDCNLEVNSYAIASDWDVADNFADTVYSQITGYETLEDVQLNWQEATTQMAEDVANEFEIFEQRYNDVMIAAGTSTIEFAGVVDQSLTYVEQKSDEAAQESERMASEFIDAYNRALSAAAQFSEQYANVAQSVISNNVQMIKSIGDLIRQLAAIGGPSYNGISDYVTSAIAPAAIAGIDKLNGEIDDQKFKNNTFSPGDDSGAKYLVQIGTEIIGTYDAATYERVINDIITNRRNYNSGTIQAKNLSTGTIRSGQASYWVRQDWSKSFDTGGYTGEWGNNGRWALLHEKELVLNKEDTQNMLQTVDSVRRIVELNTQAYGANADLSGRYGIGGIGAGLDQNVTIHAEFPNAVDHAEIEMAFNDLLNKASQYANRH